MITIKEDRTQDPEEGVLRTDAKVYRAARSVRDDIAFLQAGARLFREKALTLPQPELISKAQLAKEIFPAERIHKAKAWLID